MVEYKIEARPAVTTSYGGQEKQIRNKHERKKLKMTETKENLRFQIYVIRIS